MISKQNIHVSEENVMRSMKGPVYEEVELEDKTTTIDLSQNIAYEHVKKTVSWSSQWLKSVYCCKNLYVSIIIINFNSLLSHVKLLVCEQVKQM